MVEDSSQTAQRGEVPETSEELYRRILDSARDVVFVVGPDGNIREANETAEVVYGYPHDELVGMPLSAVRAPATRTDMSAQMQVAVAGGITFETEHVRADGTTFPVEVSSRGIELDDGVGLVSVVRDITERRDHEAERERLLSALGQANARLDALVRITSGALETLDPVELFERMLALLLETTGADVALLFEAEDDALVQRAFAGEGHILKEVVLGVGEGFAGSVARDRIPLFVLDVQDSPFHIPSHDDSGFRTMFGVPMIVAGRLHGVLEVVWREPRQLGEDDRLLLQAAADRISLGAANARLYGQTKAAQTLAGALNDLNSLVNSSFDPSQTMDAALAICASALDSDTVVLALAHGGAWHAQYAHGVELPEEGLIYEHWTADHGVTAISTPEPGSETYAWLAEKLGVIESLTVRLTVRGRQVGLLLFGRSALRGGFSQLSRDYAERFAGAIALAVANSEAFESEHRIAETLQEALLTTPTSVRGVEFAHLYRSATLSTRVGGDFYDLFELSQGRVAIAVGDVSGKGLEAAVLTSVIKDTIRAYAHDMPSPADVVARANVALGRAAKLPEFASVFFAVLDTRTSALTYCCAGHPPPAVLTSDGSIELLEGTSPVIGAFEEVEYVESTRVLERGDRVFLYTDGVTEARAGDGSFFGDERLLSTLASADPNDVVELPSTVYSEVMAFTGGHLSDDIAIVALRLA